VRGVSEEVRREADAVWLLAFRGCQSLTILARRCYFCLMPINVNLTPELEGLIRQKVSSGRYNSASEVVREALRLMEAEDQLRAAKLAQLRHEIQEGLDSGPARPWNVSELKREGRKRFSARTGAGRK
jgi:antitoxin ParD1/3/4